MEERSQGTNAPGPGTAAGGPRATASTAEGAGRSSSEGAGGVADQVQQTVGQAADQVQQAAAPVADKARETVSQVADQAGQQVSARAKSQKDRAVDALAMLAQAIRQTGQELRSQDQPALAGYVDRAAQTMERGTNYLRARDMGQLVGDTEAFARRNPTVFLGGGFALGLLAARFLKSSAPRPTGATGYPAAQSPYRMHPYATQNYGAPSGMGASTPAPSSPSPAPPSSPSTSSPSPSTSQETTTAETPAVSTTSTTPPSGEGRSATAPVGGELPLKDQDRPAGGASQTEVPVKPARGRRAPETPTGEPSSGQSE
jgi:hypothetical protein